jgi:hypothetical protein
VSSKTAKLRQNNQGQNNFTKAFNDFAQNYFAFQKGAE